MGQVVKINMASTLHILSLNLGFLSTMFQKMDLFPLPGAREEGGNRWCSN